MKKAAQPKKTITHSKSSAKPTSARKPIGTRRPDRAAEAGSEAVDWRSIAEQRTAELAVVNSVGEAMAKTLDVKTVTKIVGDKVRDIFHAEIVSIRLLDQPSNLVHSLHEYDQ